jgi:hypothetical protein
VITLALLMTLSALPTLAATAAPTAKPERRVELRIHSTALLDHQVADAADETSYAVASDTTKALSDQGVDVVDEPGAPAIAVHLSWVSYADSIYGVRIETARPGHEPTLVETFECECGDSELTAAVVARLPAALDKLDEGEPAVADPVSEPEPRDPQVDRGTEVTDDGPRKPLGTLGRAGIGVAAVGAATLVSGVIVYSLGSRFDPPTGRLEEVDGKDFRPPGVGLMVTGGAVFVAGAVLFIVDRARPRKPTSALLLPSPGGLVLTGRF